MNASKPQNIIDLVSLGSWSLQEKRIVLKLREHWFFTHLLLFVSCALHIWQNMDNSCVFETQWREKNVFALLQTVAAPNFPVIEKDPVFYCYTVTMGLSQNR